MGQIWVREFTGGLDTRRMPEATPGGVLIQGSDGHITRGGEFEKRAAFIEAYSVANTFGLAANRASLIVFGSAAAPGSIPPGITYQRLQHPDGAGVTLVAVPSFDLSKGKIYAVGVFSDGSRHHFYDEVRVEDWFDGRARCAFRITAGGDQPAVAAVGTVEIIGGTESGGNQVTSVTVNGVAVTSGAVLFDDTNAITAAALAANINAHTSSPNYAALADGAIVSIIAATAGAAANGFVVVANVGGDVTATEGDMAGGADATPSKITDITVDGIPIIAGEIEWADSNADTAEAVASAINAVVTTPDYTAIANEDQVVILAETQGESENGKAVVVAIAAGLGITPSTGLAMAGGAEEDDTFDPGTFVRTIGSKMYALAGPNMHFSGVQIPTGWTTDNVGAGFVDMSSQASGAEELKAIAPYQNYVAVFAETVVQIWYVDPDPALNRKSQVLNNTGTLSPRSVTQFGDSDLFYLDESGLRSLRARDSSNSAATSDIGIPVDSLVIEALADLTLEERESKVFGLIEPRDKRFWLVIKDRIFVFSFFSGSKVSAWTVYYPGFDVDEAIVFGRRVYLRSGDTIYVYGGLGNELTYDDTEAIAQIPYLDGDAPWQPKNLQGIDIAAKGEWRVYVAMNPNNLEAQDVIGTHYDTIADTTYNEGRIPTNGRSTHFSLILKTQNTGYAKLGALVLHYEAEEEKQT